jgi:hypothetical protein
MTEFDERGLVNPTSPDRQDDGSPTVPDPDPEPILTPPPIENGPEDPTDL